MPAPVIQGLIARVLTDALTPDAEDDRDASGRFTETMNWGVWEANSRAIQTVKHRLRDGMMTVRFRDRHLYPDYLFINVPRELFRQWKRVKSAGAFYHRRIKGQYSVS